MARRTIQGSRAIVTGASSGIGRAIASQLAAAGADVVLVARREHLLAELADQLRAVGVRVETVVGDITEESVRTAALQTAQDSFGGLDILVNNAGVSAQGNFADAQENRLRQIMEVNFFAPVALIRAALPILKQGNKPILVQIGSILGRRGIPFNAEYCASKFALQGFGESLRAELAGEDVDLLQVNPGTTDTRFFDNLIERQREMPWGNKKGVPPEKVAEAIVRAIRRGRHEITPSGSGRMLVLLNRIAPWLVDRLMARYSK